MRWAIRGHTYRSTLSGTSRVNSRRIDPAQNSFSMYRQISNSSGKVSMDCNTKRIRLFALADVTQVHRRTIWEKSGMAGSSAWDMCGAGLAATLIIIRYAHCIYTIRYTPYCGIYASLSRTIPSDRSTGVLLRVKLCCCLKRTKQLVVYLCKKTMEATWCYSKHSAH